MPQRVKRAERKRRQRLLATSEEKLFDNDAFMERLKATHAAEMAPLRAGISIIRRVQKEQAEANLRDCKHWSADEDHTTVPPRSTCLHCGATSQDGYTWSRRPECTDEA